jgi:ATP-dependent helicase HepA
MFVELPGRKGIGKLESVVDGHCAVTIFHSILRVKTIDLAIADIRRAYLSPQTRAYVRDDDRFRIGRVTNYLVHENGLIDYEIRFPNGKQSEFSETALFVRPWDAPGDPAEVLAAGGAESQFLHDRRQSAIGPLLALRSAAQGLTSLISAGVDFVPHQIAAVRRVLTDPVQRYLLADEVGLGKTIEAGLIIRQHLIDNPDTEVLISVPPHLCEQWRSELVDKLRLDQFGEAFECCAHADLARVSRSPDVLVVDEAHHLVGLESGPLLRSAERLRELASDATVLLLLSATPALGEEAKFLALLNLLDPLTHPLEDLAGFRAKLEQRREVGRLLLSLDPQAPGLVLRQRGAELHRLFPGDTLIQVLAPKLVAATREAPDDVARICLTLKEHVADCYRIHQRLIRSRRADAKGWEFMPRGPWVDGEPSLTHLRCEGDTNKQIEPLLRALEDWRFSALEAARGDGAAVSQAARRYRDLLNAAGLGADALRNWLKGANAGFGEEDEILDALRSIAAEWDDGNRIETMVESTKRLIKTLRADTSEPKIVVFTSSSDTASAFNAKYKEGADSAVIFLLTTADADGGAEVIAAFKGLRKAGVLVTDRCGEEGLNLSFADAIVHLDLPLSAARIEQRIGRLDRFGRRQGVIRHRILLPSDDDMSPWAAWYELLTGGFMIFNRSISDIQFQLEALEVQAFQTLLKAGPEGMIALAADIRARIAEERKSQDEQYALDRIALTEEPVEDFIQALEDAEEDEGALERGVDRWLIDTLQLKKHPFAWPEVDPFKLSATGQTLIPRLPWQSELGLDDVQPLTWKRRIATKRRDVVLLRPGAPLVDIMERFTRWDDRGTAFVTYRTAPDWPGDLWIGFKLCFVIEPSLELSDLLAPTRAELAKSRRAQCYFAPRGSTLYIDINGDAVSDISLIAILERPYRNEGEGAYPPDINLGSRPQMFAESIDLSAFQQICRSVRDSARDRLAGQPVFIEQIATAVRLAEVDLERRRNRLRRRQSAGDAMARTEIELIEAILPSIREPAIRLDAMGCFVVSQHAPKRRAHG